MMLETVFEREGSSLLVLVLKSILVNNTGGFPSRLVVLLVLIIQAEDRAKGSINSSAISLHSRTSPFPKRSLIFHTSALPFIHPAYKFRCARVQGLAVHPDLTECHGGGNKSTSYGTIFAFCTQERSRNFNFAQQDFLHPNRSKSVKKSFHIFLSSG
jgi:hypothetical protein